MSRFWMRCLFGFSLMAPGIASAGLNDGLVASYSFTGDASDGSGNGNACTVYGAALTTDRFGAADAAYAFDGVNDYLDCGNDASLALTDAVSLVAWVRMPSFWAGQRIAAKGGGDYELNVYQDNLRFVINNSVHGQYGLAGREAQWVFLAATYDRTVSPPGSIYLDGEPVTGTYYNDAIVDEGNSLVIGARGGLSFLAGAIDDVRIYGRALTEGEVRQLYNMGKGRILPPLKLLLESGANQNSVCGNGIVEDGEACDDGYTDACGTCNTDCSGPGTGATCGDSITCPEMEACDDGYADACGTCNADCSAPGTGSVCGDGVVCPETEVCDDGYADGCGTCNADCSAPGTGSVCGDGVVCPETEACDDGNLTTGDGCSDQCTAGTLFFSEYVEGSALNKAVEIYNGTVSIVDFAAEACQVDLYVNGAATPTTISLPSFSLEPGRVFVLCNSSIDPAASSSCDNETSALSFNGNDAVALVCNSIQLDVIGQPGVDPGLAWEGGSVSTLNSTLRRKAGVTVGYTSGGAFDPSLEWDAFPQDAFDGLGVR